MVKLFKLSLTQPVYSTRLAVRATHPDSMRGSREKILFSKIIWTLFDIFRLIWKNFNFWMIYPKTNPEKNFFSLNSLCSYLNISVLGEDYL